MDLELLLDEPQFQLPLANTTGKTFIKFLEDIYNDYIEKLKNSPDLLDGIANQFRDRTGLISIIETSCKTVLEIVKEYNSNHHSDAERIFKRYMQRMCFFLYTSGNAEIKLAAGEIFYRCKYFSPNGTPISPLKPQDFFFHTPFEIQGVVNSTRFSSSGFPSLYLTGSIAGAYLESRAQNLENFQGVKLQNKTPLFLLSLDFTKPEKSLKTVDLKSFELQLQHKSILLPLFIACFTIYNGKLATPPEYIVPQLISIWNEESNLFDGIMYPSTKTFNPLYSGKFYNYVFHPKSIKESGFCTWLKDKAFNMSPVCGWHYEKSNIDVYYVTEYPRLKVINPNVEKIEWPPASTVSITYHDTELGKMEFYMKYSTGMAVKTITF